MFFNDQVITKDGLLYREGQPANRVYIVKEGEFVITQNLKSRNNDDEDVKAIMENPLKALSL